jgi:Secretion system C-terminal sorting domain
LYKSSNGGLTWTKKFDATNLLDFYDGNGTGGQGTYDLVLMVPPQDTNKVYAGGINIWGSNDGGSSFEPVTNKYISSAPDIHVDQHFLSYNPITQNVFICNDGGIYRAPILYTTSLSNVSSGQPFPTIWANISAGLQVTSFYRMCSDKSFSNLMIAGAQDNSTYFHDGTQWNNIYGGDGMDNYVESNGDYIASSQFGNFSVSTSTGNTGFNILGGEWTTPIGVDYTVNPTNNNILYFGGIDLYESFDFGFTRNQISNFPTLSGNGFNEPPITSVAATGSRIYVTKRPLYPININGYCYTSPNGGNTWQDITSGLPDSLYFTSVEVNPALPLEAWVTCAGFSSGNKVFKTIDGGQTWTNVSYNLPNLPANMIKCVNGPNHLMMLACDVGVYYLTNNSTTWQLHNTGLPNVIVSDIDINIAANKILVSTFGRGIWSTDYNQFIADATGLNKLKEIQVAIYPNPAKDEIFVNLNTIKFAKIYDLNGSLVLESLVNNGKINISVLKEKNYMISFYDQFKNKIATNQLIKQ